MLNATGARESVAHEDIGSTSSVGCSSEVNVSLVKNHTVECCATDVVRSTCFSPARNVTLKYPETSAGRKPSTCSVVQAESCAKEFTA